MIDGHFEGSLTEGQTHHGTEEGFTQGGRSRVTIDLLPDVALLRIFDFYLHNSQIETWHTLVHVCRNWRIIVFESPRRLGLRLLCRAFTPIREKLEVWPHLPIVVRIEHYMMEDFDSIIAALKYNDRIYDLDFSEVAPPELENVLREMLQPFPALTRLALESHFIGFPHVVPASFLGGSAPRLQTLILNHVQYPGLPNLLLSTTRLVDLRILEIPPSGYISPETLVTGLSVLTRLENLDIGFSSTYRLDGRCPPPQRRIVLPVLAKLAFSGPCEYMEDLVAQIDTPLLDELFITFHLRDTFITPQLTQFVSRTPKYKAPHGALFNTRRY